MNTHKLITAIDNKWEKIQIINKDFTIDYIRSLSPKINYFDFSLHFLNNNTFGGLKLFCNVQFFNSF
jgi:hypothetical protein